MLATNSACDEFQVIAQQETQDLTHSVVERLWIHVERLLASLPLEDQLYFGGVALARIAEAVSQRADWLLGADTLAEKELQSNLGLPSVTILDEFVKESLPTLKFNHWLDENLLPSLEETEQHRNVRSRQKSNADDLHKVKNDLIALTGECRAKECQEAITSFFKQHPESISLTELQQKLDLPMVEVWMGLLLGGYGLEQRGKFYDAVTIIVTESRVTA